MNRATRRFGLLLVTTTAACAAELDPPPSAEQLGVAEPAPKHERTATAPRPAAPEGARFSSRVLDRLAERGIEVNGGRKPVTPRTLAAERTTVEQKWLYESTFFDRVEEKNPTDIPHKYAVQLTMRVPLNVATHNPSYFDSRFPGIEDHCSGTLVGNTAVLTAAHCIIQYAPVGALPNEAILTDPDAPRYVPVFDEVKMYSIHASPRRNGKDFPIKTLSAKKSYWEFSNWPGPNTVAGRSPLQYDYGVVRFNRPLAWTTPTASGIPVASRQVMASPIGKTIVVAHYPMQVDREFYMFYSIGEIGSVHPQYGPQVIRHNAGAETDSSGSGIFESTVDAVSGVNVSEAPIAGLRERRTVGQTVGPNSGAGTHPNYALLFNAASLANVNMWINATW